MLVYERIQTLIGRELHTENMKILATLLNKNLDFFFTEESTEPWKAEPEPDMLLEIHDTELANKIVDMAYETGMTPDDLVSHIARDYIIQQCLIGEGGYDRRCGSYRGRQR